MKKHPKYIYIFNILFLTCLLTVTNVAAQNLVTKQVTTLDYCIFLNAVAASDPHHLYNEANISSIVRMGESGSYYYEIIAGEENAPIMGISWLSRTRYCNWLEASERLQEESSFAGNLGKINGKISSSATSTSNVNSHIEDVTETGVYDLKGIDDAATNISSYGLIISKNPSATYWIAGDEEDFSSDSASLTDGSCGFEIATSSVPLLMLTTVSSPALTSTSNVPSYLEEVSSAAALIGLLAAPELMLRRGAAEAAPLASEKSVTTAVPGQPAFGLTINDFRRSSELYPTAQRLIIKTDQQGKALLQPQEATGGVFPFNGDSEENKKVIRSLRATLKAEHPELDVDKLFPGSGKNEIHLPGNHSSLSSERLLEVFRKIDQELLGKKMPAISPMLVAPAAPSSSQTLTAEDLYKKADLLSDQSQSAQSTRAALRRDMMRKEEAMKGAQRLFEQEKAAFEQINLHKTTLGKLSRRAGTVSKIFGSITVPLVNVSVGAPAQFISDGAEIANDILQKVPMKAAKAALTAAKENAEKAQKAFEEHGFVGGDFAVQALQAEKEAEKLEKETLLVIGERMQSAPEGADTWHQKIIARDREVKNLTDQQTTQLAPFEEELTRAQERAIEARTQANAVQKKSAAAAQAMADAMTEYQQAQQEYDALDDQAATVQASSTSKEAYDRIRKEQAEKTTQMTFARIRFQEAEAQCEEAEEEFNLQENGTTRSLEDIALDAEYKLFIAFKNYASHADHLQRDIRRAQFRANVERNVYIRFWPEEVARHEIREVVFEPSNTIVSQRQISTDLTKDSSLEMESKKKADDVDIAHLSSEMDAQKIDQLRSEKASYGSKATTARAAGKNDEAKSWKYASDASSMAAFYLEKSIEAERERNFKEVIRYEEEAKKYQKAVEDFVRSAEEYAKGNASLWLRWLGLDMGTIWQHDGEERLYGTRGGYSSRRYSHHFSYEPPDI